MIHLKSAAGIAYTARVNEVSRSFTASHIHILAAQHHLSLVCPAEDSRLSWPGLLVKISKWYATMRAKDGHPSQY